MSPSLSQLLKLSIPERILLVEALWDSILQEKAGTSYRLSEDQIQFLEEELKSYAKDPESGSSWTEIKNRLQNR